MIRNVIRPRLAGVMLALALAAVASCKSGYGGGGAPTSPGGGSAKELNSNSLGHGATFEHTFAVAGTYAYHCIFHGPMTGTVHVTADAPDMVANVSITSSSMSFPAASVKPGGQVIWTNNTQDLHTVTSN